MNETNLHPGSTHSAVMPNGDMAVDPICGMKVNQQTAAGSFAYGGTTYYFCCAHCLEKFRKDPASALQPKPQLVTLGRAPRSNAGKYTCPMHPEVIRDQPGSCPICGMALEPVTVFLAEKEDPELVEMTQRLFA